MKFPAAAGFRSFPQCFSPEPTKTSNTLRASSVYTTHGRSNRSSTAPPIRAHRNLVRPTKPRQPRRSLPAATTIDRRA